MNHYPLLIPHTAFDAAILAEGDFPSHPLALDVLRSVHPLVCCDGAGFSAMSHNVRPDAIVGDGDSMPTDMKAMLGERFIQVDEQDDNDLTKATRHVLAMQLRPEADRIAVAYLGTTGKREDHTIGNLSLMARYYAEMGVAPTFVTDHGWFVVASGHATFSTEKGQQVSIFNLTSTRLTGTGLRWAPYAFAHLWQGTLNEATASEVEIDADGMYLIFRCFAD